MKPIKRIVVGVDFSEATDEVFQSAVDLARVLGASLDFVHVREPFQYPISGAGFPVDAPGQVTFDWIEDSLGKVATRALDLGVIAITSSLQGPAATRIVEHAQKVEADLILVGTHGRGGLAHALVGSVAERVVQRAGRPVLVVPITAARRAA